MNCVRIPVDRFADKGLPNAHGRRSGNHTTLGPGTLSRQHFLSWRARLLWAASGLTSFLFPRLGRIAEVIHEAAACGLPVITRKNYQPETVVGGQTGYLVAPDDELFVRLEELLCRPDLRQTLGRAGRKHSEQFDWDRIAQQ